MGFYVKNALSFVFRTLSSKADTSTMKYLNVAEKNDAAKNIAALLSRGNSNRREGFSPYNKIYEFDATVVGQNSRMVMTSVSGHLLNYEFAGNFRSWKGCNPIQLFDAPILKTCSEDYQKIKRTLEREIRSCDGLIIWTDCDREGENIGFEIIKVCTDVKPNLRIFRAKFSEITGPSIFRALSTLGQPNKNISDAVDVRQELDLRTGAAFTRLQTLRLQQVFPDKLADKLISYGSCQFPTLGFVVDRYQALEEFIEEQFWKIIMNHQVKEIKTDFNWKRDRLFDKPACEAILDICQENPTATVEKVENKSKSKWRPLPLDTVEMEKTVSRKLKITAKETMRIAERLYTQGFISYPRTETNIFPRELNLTNLVVDQQNDQRWGQFAQRIIAEGGPNPRQGRKSDQAHPPIHPTKYTNNLQGNEQRVYEYIVRHFLACVQKDAQGFETVVTADVAAEKFIAKGLIILEKNYLEVYIYEKWNAKEINNYQEGDTFIPTELALHEGATSPPKLLTEADLIALMDKHGIGTDATHADHIETIKSREYVGLHENIYFVPGTLGMGLVEGYNNIGLDVSLAKPILRADFEKDLSLICEGVKDAETVKREQIAKYRAVFQTVMDRMGEIDTTLGNRLEHRPRQVQDDFNNGDGGAGATTCAMKCPKCGNEMFLKNLNGKKVISCCGFPNCKNSIWFDGNVESVEVLDDTCPQCGPNTHKLKIKFKQNVFIGEPNPNILCIGGCDMNVLDTLDISLQSVQNRNNGAPVQNNIANRNNQNNQNIANAGNRQNLNNLNNRQPNRMNGHNDRANASLQNVSFNNQTNNRLNNTMPVPGGSRDNNSIQTGEDIVCSCNVEAVLLTVRKDGPNKGRKFYKCANGSCAFFLWDPASDNRETATVNQPQNNEINCNCNNPAVLRTVAKDGPNKGKQFYCCAKPMGTGCGFFQWADQADPGAGGRGNDDGDDFGGGGGGGYQPSWRGKMNANVKNNKRTAPYDNSQSRAKRKCSKCKQEGHMKNKCPN